MWLLLDCVLHQPCMCTCHSYFVFSLLHWQKNLCGIKNQFSEHMRLYYICIFPGFKEKGLFSLKHYLSAWFFYSYVTEKHYWQLLKCLPFICFCWWLILFIKWYKKQEFFFHCMTYFQKVFLNTLSEMYDFY